MGLPEGSNLRPPWGPPLMEMAWGLGLGDVRHAGWQRPLRLPVRSAQPGRRNPTDVQRTPALVPSNVLALPRAGSPRIRRVSPTSRCARPRTNDFFRPRPYCERVEGAPRPPRRGVWSTTRDWIQSALEGVDVQNPEAIQEAMASGVFEQEDTPEQKAALARSRRCWRSSRGSTMLSMRPPRRVCRHMTGFARRCVDVGHWWTSREDLCEPVGLELRPRRLREAAQPGEKLRETGGIEARDALWAHPDLLPTADDLDDIDAFWSSGATSTTASSTSPDPWKTRPESGDQDQPAVRQTIRPIDVPGRPGRHRGNVINAAAPQCRGISRGWGSPSSSPERDVGQPAAEHALALHQRPAKRAAKTCG